MDQETYAAQMLNYYTNRVDPQTDQSGCDYSQSLDRDFATDGHWLREMAMEVQRVFAGRDVLELAAGMGRWTRFMLATARSVLATDASPRALTRLRDGATHGRELPPGRFEMMELDAFYPERAPGIFNGALVANWLQHMPREGLDSWIQRLHTKLLPNSVVMVAINHLGPKSRSQLFSKPRDPNFYEPRKTFDWQPAEIIDNVFSEPDLREMFGKYAKSMRFECGIAFYWLVYELPS